MTTVTCAGQVADQLRPKVPKLAAHSGCRQIKNFLHRARLQSDPVAYQGAAEARVSRRGQPYGRASVARLTAQRPTVDTPSVTPPTTIVDQAVGLPPRLAPRTSTERPQYSGHRRDRGQGGDGRAPVYGLGTAGVDVRRDARIRPRRARAGDGKNGANPERPLAPAPAATVVTLMLTRIACPNCGHIGAASAASLPRVLICSQRGLGAFIKSSRPAKGQSVARDEQAALRDAWERYEATGEPTGPWP
jgi:hypothetical protein